jgi:hypothetical protein
VRDVLFRECAPRACAAKRVAAVLRERKGESSAGLVVCRWGCSQGGLFRGSAGRPPGDRNFDPPPHEPSDGVNPHAHPSDQQQCTEENFSHSTTWVDPAIHIPDASHGKKEKKNVLAACSVASCPHRTLQSSAVRRRRRHGVSMPTRSSGGGARHRLLAA